MHIHIYTHLTLTGTRTLILTLLYFIFYNTQSFMAHHTLQFTRLHLTSHEYFFSLTLYLIPHVSHAQDILFIGSVWIQLIFVETKN